MNTLPLLAALGLTLQASWSAAGSPPKFALFITPQSLDKPIFQIKGSVSYCPDGDKTAFSIPEGADFSFTRNNAPLAVSPKKEVEWKCVGREQEDAVHFDGVSAADNRKCEASDGEIYCLDGSRLNPEILSKTGLYDLHFELPEGYAALTPTPSVETEGGVQFQIARFGDLILRRSKRLSFEYLFPAGFSAESKYLSVIEATLERYLDVFGELPFSVIRVGAIRRGQSEGKVNGSPAGNLILFSRTALRDAPNLDELKALGAASNLSDAVRRWVIAHELSRFWLGRGGRGKDGPMTEGVANYLGLLAVRKNSETDYQELLRIKAYDQGALALAAIGADAGHDALVSVIADVYGGRKDPSFSDFDAAFKKLYPEKAGLWDSAWAVPAAP